MMMMVTSLPSARSIKLSSAVLIHLILIHLILIDLILILIHLILIDLILILSIWFIWSWSWSIWFWSYPSDSDSDSDRSDCTEIPNKNNMLTLTWVSSQLEINFKSEVTGGKLLSIKPPMFGQQKGIGLKCDSTELPRFFEDPFTRWALQDRKGEIYHSRGQVVRASWHSFFLQELCQKWILIVCGHQYCAVWPLMGKPFTC